MVDRWVFNQDLELWVPFLEDDILGDQLSEPEDDVIDIKLMDQDGIVSWYQMQSDLPLRLLFTLYCRDAKKSLGLQRFYLFGTRIFSNQTPNELNMSSMDCIDVFEVQHIFKEKELDTDGKYSVSATVGTKIVLQESDEAGQCESSKAVPVGVVKSLEIHNKIQQVGANIKGCFGCFQRFYVQPQKLLFGVAVAVGDG